MKTPPPHSSMIEVKPKSTLHNTKANTIVQSLRSTKYPLHNITSVAFIYIGRGWGGGDRDFNLTTNDGNGRQGIPESRKGARVSMVSQSRACSLYLVYQRYQILHLFLFSSLRLR